MKPTGRRSLLGIPLTSLLLYLMTSLLPLSASAQVQPGTPAFGSFGGGTDILNLGNNNVHLGIPVFHKAGRGGFNFAYDLGYDTSVWYPVGVSGSQSWQPVGNWGWSGGPGGAGGGLSYNTTDYTCQFCNQYTCWYPVGQVQLTNWVYQDVWGARHTFSGTAIINTSGCPSQYGGPNSSGFTSTATDGSGWTLTVTGSSNSGTLTSVITNADGTAVTAPNAYSSGTTTFGTDRNGNQITTDGSGHFYDTLSSTTPVLTVGGSGTPSSPTTFTYAAPSGANASYTMKYTTYSIRTNFGCSGISEYGANGTTTANLVSEIDLPDGSKYTFGYESTPGHSGFVTGRLASITLPTGGTISYSYSGGSNGIVCADGSAATLQRTTPDGTWIYAHSQYSGSHWQTVATDPANNQTQIDFQKDSASNSTNSFYEVLRKSYQGSTGGTLLRQWTTCYNGNTTNCATTAVSSPITQRNVNDQFGSSGLQAQHNYFYDSTGGLTEQDDYDYGSSSYGALLRKTLVSYASLGNITAFQQTVTVCNGTGSSQSCLGASGSSTGTVVAQTNYNYDEANTLTTTSGIAQHTSVSGSRGNLTSVNYPVSGLTSHFTYYDTGSPNTSKDVNGATTTYNYDTNHVTDCQKAFPIGITEAITSLTQSYTWNCTGGVQLTSTDENGQVITTTYNDPYFWRPSSSTDQAGFTTNICYAALTSTGCPSTPSATQVETYLNFNSNNSTVDQLTTLDGLGRVHVQQTRQGPYASSSNFDSVETDYDSFGRISRVTVPYTGTAGQTNSSAPAATTTYDALSRVYQVTDGGNGTAAYTYSTTSNDTLVAIGPAPTGENKKQRQFEYNSLGWLTSVCELTSGTTPWPGGTCLQNSSQTGYWTKYALDALGNILTVTQNAQSSSNQQTRSYSFDAMSRLTSESNGETGTTNYKYDSDSTCGTSTGDLVKKVDAVGNTSCISYDSLHRKLSITYPSGSYASVTPSKYFVYDSATVNSTSMANAKSRLAEAYTCTSCPGTKLTDLGFSYSARGESSDVYEETPNSGHYYHLSQTYWPHGAASQLTAAYNGNSITGLPTISYGGTIGSTVGLDGEGRITQVTAGSGQNPVTGVTYNNGNLPTQVNFGSGDNDIFAYDANTFRITQFKFNVGTQSKYLNGAFTWNANGTLGQLALTDQFNSGNTQTCNYTHDDLSRIAQVDCGSGGWGQAFSYVSGVNAGYDPFGNLDKGVLSNHTGNSFQPTYSATTNQFASIPGCSSLSYDSNGNLKNDCNHTYTWDADGNSITIDSVGLTFDALDRMVEQNRSGAYTQIVYGPGGGKLALMSGSSLTKAFVQLPGQATAVYTGSGLDHYRHSDLLGSARLTSSPTQSTGFLSSLAYAPFGETYASLGTTDPSFTGMNPDTVSTDYDFLAREYSNEGRWVSPDPVGLGAVDPSNPQSWNRYAYAVNNPLALIDPLGLFTLPPCMTDPEEYGCPPTLPPPPPPVDCIGDPENCMPPDPPQAGCPPIAGSNCSGPGYGGGGAGTSAPLSPKQIKCAAKIQASVQNNLNPTSVTNLGPYTGAPMDNNGMKGGAYNVNFFVTGVTLGPYGSANAVPGATCGRFNDGLHIPIPGAPGCPTLNDPTIFSGPGTYNGQTGYFFTAHIDSGNANTFWGSVKHIFLDVFLGNLGRNHGC